jgi:hypothetical protein
MKTLIILLFLITPLIQAHAQEKSNPKAWAELLFPETRTWKDFDSLPQVKFSAGVVSKTALADAYAKSEAKALSPECDLVAKTLETNERNYRTLDIDLDGKTDVIYNGPNPCGEGNLVMTWIAGKKTYKFTDHIRQNSLYLRVLPSNKPTIVGVSIGCCDSVTDEYFVLGNDHSSLYIMKDTVRPQRPVEMAKPFTTNQEISLRSSPKIENAYNESASEHLQTAVFGNLTGKYLAGAKGSILAEQSAKNGEKWVFVSMDGSESKRFYNVEKVNVGWTPMAQLFASSTEPAAKIVKISDGSIYDQLGLKTGDVIKKLNDQDVNAKSILEKLKTVKPGEKLKLTIQRDQKEETLFYDIK